jgi:hypothetical protein
MPDNTKKPTTASETEAEAKVPTEVSFKRHYLQPPTPAGETRKRFREGRVYSVGTGAKQIDPDTAVAAIKAGAAVAVAKHEQPSD